MPNIDATRESGIGRRTCTTTFALAWVTVFAAALQTHAQCGAWLPGQGVHGIDGTVLAMTEWDPDGDGPQPPWLVVGGTFSTAGDVRVNNIAAYGGQNWHALGSGMDSGVRALTVYNGQLIAGGAFFHADEDVVWNVAAWNGVFWHSLGSGIGTQYVFALTVFGDDLIAGCSYQQSVSVGAGYATRWNGSVWQPLGSGMNDYVEALAAFDDQLFAGGRFTTAGDQVSAYVARWQPAPSTPADLDDDCDVDVDDLAIFKACAAGPAVLHDASATCRRADLDSDDDVDQRDFGVLQQCMSGSDTLADPACVQ